MALNGSWANGSVTVWLALLIDPIGIGFAPRGHR
jgi:hypothetical protein